MAAQNSSSVPGHKRKRGHSSSEDDEAEQPPRKMRLLEFGDYTIFTLTRYVMATKTSTSRPEGKPVQQEFRDIRKNDLLQEIYRAYRISKGRLIFSVAQTIRLLKLAAPVCASFIAESANRDEGSSLLPNNRVAKALRTFNRYDWEDHYEDCCTAAYFFIDNHSNPIMVALVALLKGHEEVLAAQ